ncbi:MAG: Alpha/beta hydrolase family protein [Deltaproteobacteria bacterium]|nr:Alpha/beta hydrolase family protein [Deltaproteobacteria bacterium]
MSQSPSLQVQEPSAAGKPWVILIHGLGLSRRSWIDPFSESLLGGAISFDYVLTNMHSSPPLSPFSAAPIFGCSPPMRLAHPAPLSFSEFLKMEGYGILTWSQEKSRGRIEYAVGELQAILEAIPNGEKKVLLGHSRGGLVARKYLQDRRPGWDRISAVLLLGVPNHGSRLAKLAGLLGWPLLSFLFGGGKNRPSSILQKGKSESASFLIRNLAGYSSEDGIEELAPRSIFMRGLASGEGEERKNKIPYCNLIGTRTDFIRIYLRSSPTGRATPIFSLFDGLERILPRSLIPIEIQQGRGDGQVTIKSAWLPWVERNHLLPVNHAQFLVNSEVQTKVQNFLKTI